MQNVFESTKQIPRSPETLINQQPHLHRAPRAANHDQINTSVYCPFRRSVGSCFHDRRCFCLSCFLGFFDLQYSSVVLNMLSAIFCCVLRFVVLYVAFCISTKHKPKNTHITHNTPRMVHFPCCSSAVGVYANPQSDADIWLTHNPTAYQSNGPAYHP